MERDSAELSATEQIRASQEWASGTGHVLNLWAAAMRKALNPAIDEELRGALTESEYARYHKEHQRPALLEAIRARVLAGKDVRSVTGEITRPRSTGPGQWPRSCTDGSEKQPGRMPRCPGPRAPPKRGQDRRSRPQKRSTPGPRL